jgi:hypothetical protein
MLSVGAPRWPNVLVFENLENQFIGWKVRCINHLDAVDHWQPIDSDGNYRKGNRGEKVVNSTSPLCSDFMPTGICTYRDRSVKINNQY